MLDELTIATPAMARCAVSASGTTVPDAHPVNVLLIEPDADCADALSAILASLPRIDDVQVVADVREAARSLADTDLHPAIILVDDHPGSTEILRTIDVLTEFAPQSTLILLCVYPQCVDRRVRERVSGCVSKDVSRAELARVVDEFL